MSKSLTSEQKKKRLRQLRDAQRRRRSKLKVESRHFVQIILPTHLLENLRQMAADSKETVQHLISRLVEQCVEQNFSPTPIAPVAPDLVEELPSAAAQDKAEVPDDPPEEVPKLTPAEINDPDQLDLFA